MKCPLDGTELQMTERQGVEIDYCPRCRGVWLDRGELDKIIERSENGGNTRPGQVAPVTDNRSSHDQYNRDQYSRQRYDRDRDDRERYDRDDDDDYRKGRRKKRGFLGELFDFD